MMGEERLGTMFKDVEEEIDQAIDQLFIGEAEETSSDQSTAAPTPPKQAEAQKGDKESAEEMDGAGKTGKQIMGEGSEEETKIRKIDPYLHILESLQHRVRAFTEWGITEVALDKVMNGMEEIRKAFANDDTIQQVVKMVTEILSHLRENPVLENGELVDFLLSAFDFTKRLMEMPMDQRGHSEEKKYDEIRARFMDLSSRAMLGPGKYDKTGATPPQHKTADEGRPSWLEQNDTWEASSHHKPSEKPVPQTHPGEKADTEEEEIIDLGLETLTTKAKKGLEASEETPVRGGGALGPLSGGPKQDLGTENVPREGIRGKEPTISIEKESPLTSLHALTITLEDTLRRVKMAFLESVTLKNLMERLGIEIAELDHLCERVGKSGSVDLSRRGEGKRLAPAIARIREDFNQLTIMLGAENDQDMMKIEALIPVVVGKKVIALREASVEAVYSINQGQEKQFRERGTILLRNKRLPFVDLIEEYREVSSNPDHRLVIVKGKGGERGLLVDKVLKPRYAIMVRADTLNILSNAKIYHSEEMPVYEID